MEELCRRYEWTAGCVAAWTGYNETRWRLRPDGTMEVSDPRSGSKAFSVTKVVPAWLDRSSGVRKHGVFQLREWANGATRAWCTYNGRHRWVQNHLGVISYSHKDTPESWTAVEATPEDIERIPNVRPIPTRPAWEFEEAEAAAETPATEAPSPQSEVME